MKLIIDIPKNYYKDLMSLKLKDNEHLSYEMEMIRKGIPLPKGHGRLIDADKIIAEATELMKYPKNHEYMECVIAHMRLADTIVKADKESEDIYE